MNPARLRAYLYLLVTVIIWAFAGVVIKVTLYELTPFVFLAYRFLLTVIVMTPIFLFRKIHLPKKEIRNLILISVFGSTLNLGLLFYGIKSTTVVDQAVITAVSPILVILAGAIILKEHVTKKEKIGIFITVVGTFILTIQPILETNGSDYSSFLGNVFLVLSNLAWVGYVLLSKKGLREKIDPLFIVYFGFLVGLVTIFPLAVIESGSISNMINIVSSASFKAHLGVFYMAVFSGALAYFLFQLGQKTIEVSEATLFVYLQAVFTIPFAVVLLGEKITLTFVIGSLIVVLGVVIAEWKKKRYN